MKNQISSLTEYLKKYQESVDDPKKFWGEIADTFYWHKKWDDVVDWYFEGEDAPNVKWFLNAKLNITENIFERNLPY